MTGIARAAPDSGGVSVLAERFAGEIHDMLARIEKEEFQVIDQAAEVVARSMMSGGILHIFGTGHSHLVAEEVLYRAGVLAPVDAILEPRSPLRNPL